MVISATTTSAYWNLVSLSYKWAELRRVKKGCQSSPPLRIASDIRCCGVAGDHIYNQYNMMIRGICNQFLTSGGGMISRYNMGLKRCTECSLFIKFEGIRCPCCSHVLRTKSRSRDNHQTFRFWESIHFLKLIFL